MIYLCQFSIIIIIIIIIIYLFFKGDNLSFLCQLYL